MCLNVVKNIHTLFVFIMGLFNLSLFSASSDSLPDIYSLSAKDINGNTIRFSEFKGKKLLIVNTASKCGFTPQYGDLQKLYDRYKDNGLVIIGFPCNDFGEQEKGSADEIKNFCQRNYGVSFLMMEKIHVKGENIHPVYAWLTNKDKNGVGDSRVKWNFQKYLINEKGQLYTWVNSWRSPLCGKITRWIER